MSKATKDRIVRLKIWEMFLEMKWVITGVSIFLTTQTNKTYYTKKKTASNTIQPLLSEKLGKVSHSQSSLVLMKKRVTDILIAFE